MMTNLGLPKTYGLTRDSGSQGICDCSDRFVMGPPKYREVYVQDSKR